MMEFILIIMKAMIRGVLTGGFTFGLNQYYNYVYKPYRKDLMIKENLRGVVGIKATYDDTRNPISGFVRSLFGYDDTHSSRGCGFFVGRNRILTNYHVLEEYLDESGRYRNTKLLVRNHKMDEISNVSVVGWNKEKDLCLLEIDDSGNLANDVDIGHASELSDRIPLIGESVYAISISNCDEVVNVTYGKANHIFESDEDTSMISTNLHIPNGFSGSPLFDDSGRVIGINTESYSPENNISSAVTVSEIRGFLEGVKIDS